MTDEPPEFDPQGIPSFRSDSRWESLLTAPAVSQVPVASNTEAPIQEEPPEPTVRDDDLITKQIVRNMEHDREMRGSYADKAYCLVHGCVIAWFFMLFAQGIIYAVTGRIMWSDKVLMAVTTGVTVSVLAAFLGVIRGLFPISSKEKKSD